DQPDRGHRHGSPHRERVAPQPPATVPVDHHLLPASCPSAGLHDNGAAAAVYVDRVLRGRIGGHLHGHVSAVGPRVDAVPHAGGHGNPDRAGAGPHGHVTRPGDLHGDGTRTGVH